MKQKDKIVNRHNLINKVTRSASLALTFTLFAFLDQLESIFKIPNYVIAIIIIVIMIILVSIISYKTSYQFLNLLYIDCDPELFYEVSKEIFKKDEDALVTVEIFYNFYIGKYDTVVDIINTHEKLLKEDETLFYYLQANFLLNNLNAINKVWPLDKAYWNNKRRLGRIDKYVISNFCNFALSYLQGDYNKAKDIVVQFQNPYHKRKILDLYNIYYLAICEYQLGHNEEAKLLFAELTNYNQDLFIVKSANEYLERIK